MSLTKLGGWVLAIGAAVVTLCENLPDGSQPTWLCTACTVAKLVMAGGFGTMVTGLRNAFDKSTTRIVRVQPRR